MAESAHSKFSASAASRWLQCPGSMVLSAGKLDSSSEYAAWGTVAHAHADICLSKGLTMTAEEDLGQIHNTDGYTIVVDDEMVDCVNTYLANVREMTAGADIVESESRTNYAQWLGVATDLAWGTADCTAVVGAELQVHDLKTGRGVEVDARDNEQMMLYAGGKLLEFDGIVDIETIRLVIHQPRLSARPSEWLMTRAELEAWLTGRARSGASSVLMAEQMYPDAAEGATDWHETFLRPSSDACRFCKAKATCPALRAEVAQTAGTDADITEAFQPVLDDMHHVPEKVLALCLSKVDMIEDWCKAVRAEVERRLLAGDTVPGYKLVQGKRGARQWADPAQAEKLLRETFRLPIEKAYDLKLISPTTAEKLAKAGDIGPRQWPKAQTLIVQRDGQPSVAPTSDPRPALAVSPVEDAFEVQADAIC